MSGPTGKMNSLITATGTALALALGAVASPAQAQTQTADPKNPARAAARAEADNVRRQMDDFKAKHGRMPNPQEFAAMRGKPAAPDCEGVNVGNRSHGELLDAARKARATGNLEEAARLADPALLRCAMAGAAAAGSGSIAADAAVESINGLKTEAECKGATNYYKDKLTSPIYGADGGARISAALKNCGPK